MTRMSTLSATPASAARSRASAAWFSDSVMPVTEAPCSRATWIENEPQPQPTSSTRSPGFSASLAAVTSSLACCACLERRALRAREERAAVRHRLVEEQREVLVRDVVVVADGAAVALGAVPAALGLELGGRHRRRLGDAGGLRGGGGEPQLRAAVERRHLEAVEQRQHRVEIVDVERAADVRAAEAELAGRAQRVRRRGGRADVERGPVAGAAHGRPVPEGDVEGALRERRGDLPPQRAGPSERHRARRPCGPGAQD